MLGIEAIESIPAQQTNNDDNDDDDDEFGDEEFEEIEVKPLEQNDRVGPSSSKLPPTQRIFPLSFEPGMIQDATYGGPVRRQVTENVKKDKGKQKVDPKREGEFPYYFSFTIFMADKLLACRIAYKSTCGRSKFDIT
jgi:hypothetical protein